MKLSAKESRQQKERERELLEIVLSFQKVTVLTGFPLKHDQLKK